MPFQFNHYYMILCETKCLQVLTPHNQSHSIYAMDGHEADSVLAYCCCLYFILLPNRTLSNHVYLYKGSVTVSAFKFAFSHFRFSLQYS